MTVEREEAEHSNAPIDQKRVHVLASSLRQDLREAEDKWRISQARKHNRDPAMTWRQLNEWLNKKATSSPKQLRMPSGEISNSPRTNAECMNSYYKEKVQQIKQTFGVDGDPLKYMNNYKVGCRSSLKEVLNKDVLRALSKMKNSSSLGLDSIPIDLLKKTKFWTANLLFIPAKPEP